eukprot:TRINITY_DN38140_c0_g1_i1.p1 TRINITY_DN38140_c0_g1~~TRINITY_DN38140_c0_g1_i1.p1  ORF type:complete len:544 (-),score=126.70 TRINITY_DN38140_c0_g1_i1:203-1834(-)
MVKMAPEAEVPKLAFAKMTAGGPQDFVVAAWRGGEDGPSRLNVSALAKAMCDRKRGVGADALLLVVKATPAGFKEGADLRMRVLLPDGSEQPNHKEGVRCVSLFAQQLRLGKGPEFNIETGSGVAQSILATREESKIGPVEVLWRGEWALGEGVLQPSQELPHGIGWSVAAYDAPLWTPPCAAVPKCRVHLAALPTPLKRITPAGLPDGCEMWIKRDDHTGCETSGNKARKLDFLLGEALRQGCDSVITVGGIQSNHCRATAASARLVGLEPHLLLKVGDDAHADPGLEGNLMLDRLLDARVHLVPGADFAKEGGWGLCQILQESLKKAGKKPFAFPSGGSNALGCWGYIESVSEVLTQAGAMAMDFDKVYFACGSGGTAAGLALGLHWSGALARGTELVALGVDDTPEIFYAKLAGLFKENGEHNLRPEDALRIVHAVGDGYAQSTEEELKFLAETAGDTGVVFDPVYSVKAARAMMQELKTLRPTPKRVLFIHTGGLLGIYAKKGQLLPLMNAKGHGSPAHWGVATGRCTDGPSAKRPRVA